MSTIPIQSLIIDNDTDIGLSSDLINGTYKSSSLTDLSNNLYSKITDLSSNLNTKINTKQNIISVVTPLIKNDISNNITIDLSAYPLKTYVDGSLNTINSNINSKENILTFNNPLTKSFKYCFNRFIRVSSKNLC